MSATSASKKPRSNNSVVERAMRIFGGSTSEFARQLSKISGHEITRQRVHGWRLRGVFPRDIILHVEQLCKIPAAELIMAKPYDRDEGNVVERAIRLAGVGGSAAEFANKLSAIAGTRKFTRQMVNNWRVNGQFPLDVVPFVHLLSNIPVRDMLPRSSPAAARRLEKDEG